MKEDWSKDFIRDLIALGGIPFFILVIMRVSMMGNNKYPTQFVIGGIIFLLLMLIFKANLHAGLGLVILIFTILYYREMDFSVFASLAYVGLIGSLFYLKKDKFRIVKGILFGALSSGISYWLVELIF